MGQTLTHGIYLPEEGERNCYNGLAGNWQLLDGAVGTVAEHTSQIAGKAPAVHTHTKSDITDLFNSANTWSGSQTFTDTYIKNSDVTWGIEPSSAKHSNLYFTDSSDIAIGYVRRRVVNGAQGIYVAGRAPVKNGQLDPTGNLITWGFSQIFLSDGSTYFSFDGSIGNSIVPRTNNTYDLGSSSYQWNNIYAKNYYYNGVAWGLDKANTWTGVNTFSGATNCIIIQKFGTSGAYSDTRWYDNNDSNFASLRCKTNSITLGLKYSSASAWYDGSSISINDNGSVNIKSYDGTDAQYTYFKNNAVYPSVSSVTDLGTTTKKWKTLNGINPGALSLPDKPGGSGTVNVNYFDLSGNVTVKDGSTYNSYTALCDGWIVIGSFASEISIEDDTTNLATTAVPKSNGYAQAYLPVRQGDTVRITINQTNTQYQNFKLIPCQGNV